MLTFFTLLARNDMDVLLESESDGENEIDEILEVTKTKVRSGFRSKQLLKLYAIREILKWKYNYFESNAHEHPSYRQHTRALHNNFRKSFAFKRRWRLFMDDEFDDETLKMQKIYLERQLKKTSQSQDSNLSLPSIDPARLLVNYDREVLCMMRRLRNEFNFYLLYPESYPLYEAEKKNFLIDQCIAAANKTTRINMDDVDKHFARFWEKRIALLCDIKISQEKKRIRRDWKLLLPIYHDLGEDTSCQEFQKLLLSDNEHETDDE